MAIICWTTNEKFQTAIISPWISILDQLKPNEHTGPSIGETEPALSGRRRREATEGDEVFFTTANKMEPAENISKSKENLQNDSQDDLSQNGSHANSTEDLVADAAEAPKDAESEEAAAIAAAQAAEAAAQAAQAAEAAKKEKQSSADLSSNTGMPKVFRGGDHLVFIEKQEAEFSDLLKKRRELIQETNLDRSSAPPQYTQTSSRYQKLLDYVENFRHQYGQIFPGRKELLLSPLNEFGIPVSAIYAYWFYFSDLIRNSSALTSDRRNFNIRSSTIIIIAQNLYRIFYNINRWIHLMIW